MKKKSIIIIWYAVVALIICYICWGFYMDIQIKSYLDRQAELDMSRQIELDIERDIKDTLSNRRELREVPIEKRIEMYSDYMEDYTKIVKDDDNGLDISEEILEDSVTFTLPRFLAKDATQEILDESVADGRCLEAYFNEDGSITYKMEKGKHTEFMEGYAVAQKEILTSYYGNEEYPNFTNIEVDDNFTHYDVYCTTEELTSSDTNIDMLLTVQADLYHRLNGTNADIEVSVDYINEAGEVFIPK